MPMALSYTEFSDQFWSSLKIHKEGNALLLELLEIPKDLQWGQPKKQSGFRGQAKEKNT